MALHMHTQKNPVRAMVGMRIQNCNDSLFGNSLCRYQANFTLAIMFCTDLTREPLPPSLLARTWDSS